MFAGVGGRWGVLGGAARVGGHDLGQQLRRVGDLVALDHRADEGDVEAAGELEVVQEVGGVEAAGAELVGDAELPAGGRQVGGLRRVVPVQRRVVAQLEQVDVPGGGL